FTLYPLIPPHAMGEILGISQPCLAALNTTLPCDPNIFQWTIKIDDVYWTEKDVGALCVPNCISKARDWSKAVQVACRDDWMTAGERAVPAESLSLRFLEGLEMACMRSKSNEWCLLKSYEWVGSDVVQVDCAAKPNDPWCIDKGNVSAENSRMSSLYDDDILCSECFLKTLHARLSSEFLQDTDYADYLVDEFQDIQSVCKTTVGDLTTRAIPGYPAATETSNPGQPEPDPGHDEPPEDEDPDDGDDAEDPQPDIPTNCTGRAIDVRYASGEGVAACNELSLKYGVATGELMLATNSEECYSFNFVCVPERCQLLRTGTWLTCRSESIASALSNATDPVNMAQIATWNPNIQGACDFLVQDQYICINAPGGSWIRPPESELPSDGNGPVRGGPGSTPTLPIIEDPRLVPSDRVQKGIPSNCRRFVKADSAGATCWKVANDAKISQAELFKLNPVLGAQGEHCNTQLWLGYYYCVAAGTAPGWTTLTTIPTATTTIPLKPSPTQDGFNASCNKWVKAAAGDSCWKLAEDAKIEITQLYKWNTALGAKGENCATIVWPGYYYCIGVSKA
ncbi:hypothetical protein B0I35DRAFT_337390, partial [Stachybotrys elegans]